MKILTHQQSNVKIIVGIKSSIFYFIEDNIHHKQIIILSINTIGIKIISKIFLNL